MLSPEQLEYAELLTRKGRVDLAAVRALHDDVAIDEAVGFHAQQAVEKALKAVLVVAGVEIPYTHDLERLLTLVRGAGHDPPPAVVAAGWLTPWAVDFRYDEATDPLDGHAALTTAEAAIRWATDILEEHPTSHDPGE